MFLRSVLDIDPENPMIRELNNLAFEYDLFDMVEVVVIARESQAIDVEGMTGSIGIKEVYVAIQLALVCAIVNYALWKYETFEVKLPVVVEEGEAWQFCRSNPSEIHKISGNLFFTIAKELVRDHLPLYSTPTSL